MTLLSNVIAILFLVLHGPLESVYASSWNESLPLATSEDKVRGFLKVSSLIPEIVSTQNRYKIDPLTLINSKKLIEIALEDDPAYQRLKDQHNELQVIQISRKADLAGSSTPSEFRPSPPKQAQGEGEVELKEADYLAQIRSGLRSPDSGRSQSIEAAIALFLPTELRRSFYKLELGDQIGFLRKHLPEDLLKVGFQPEKIGWSDSSLSKSELIDRYLLAKTVDQDLTRSLVKYFSWSHLSPSKKASLFDTWVLEPFEKAKLESFLKSRVFKGWSENSPIQFPHLLLREVPPLASLFRGFVGKDCSSQESFPFSHLPSEFVYFVYDAKGGTKGYVQGTQVLAKGEPVFYLHTIAGPRISGNDTLDIIDAFGRIKGKMGWKSVLLPSLGNQAKMINFVQIREALAKVTSSESTQLTYEDSHLRQLLVKNFSVSSKYDLPSVNRIGFHLKEDFQERSINVSTTQAESLELLESSLNPAEIIKMLLHMEKEMLGGNEIVSKMLSMIGVPYESFENLVRLVDNPESLGIDAFTKKLSLTFQSLGISLEESFFKKEISFASLGYLKCPDLSEDPIFFEKLVDVLVFQRQIGKLDRFLSEYPRFFENPRIVEKFFKAFFVDVHEVRHLPSNTLELALKHGTVNILKNSQLLDSICSEPRSFRKVSQFLFAHPEYLGELSSSPLSQRLRAEVQRLQKHLAKSIKIAAATVSEGEFESHFKSFFAKNTFDTISFIERNEIFRKTLVVTLEHYIALKPGKSVLDILLQISPSGSGDDLARANENEIRQIFKRLIPYSIQSCPDDRLLEYRAKIEKLQGRGISGSELQILIDQGLRNRSKNAEKIHPERLSCRSLL